MNKKILLKTRSRSILTLLVMFVCTSVFAQSIETDPLVKAMREELSYNLEQLKQKPIPAYHMSIRLNDTYQAQVSSNFGISIVTEDRSRVLTPQVRVGSPEVDNFKFESQSRNRNSYSSSTQGVRVPFTDGAIMAVRQGIWSETMNRYSIAVNNYNDALSQMKTNADNEDKAPCFSDAPVEQYYEQPLPQSAYTFDRKYWEERMDRISSVFKECPQLEQGTANIVYTVERIYVLTSDGSTVVQNRKNVRLMLNAVIRATDGMTCPLYKDWFSYSLDDLPSDEVLIETVKDLIQRLLALREAPIAEPYAGPAIMSGSASGVFFHEIFGHRLEAHRMKSGGQTFKKLVGELVLPEGFQVYDDPTLDNYAGTSLYGHYNYDDEGVKAERVQCVKDGVLTNFLVDRTPIDGFGKSNGHGRAAAGYDAVSRQSNLLIETNNPYTDEQLRQMLIKAVKEEKKEYGYYFRTATSGLTYLGDGGSINSFNVDPVEVYRVYADGRPDELVRGVTLIGTPLAMFSGIAAGGQTPHVFTGNCGAESGWVPVTAISPMIYIKKVETQRSEVGYDLPQYLERPGYSNYKGSDQEVIFKAMKDEMDRSMTGLKADGQEPPFYADYRVNVTKSLELSSVLGGLVSSTYNPIVVTGSLNWQVGDSICSNSPMTMSMSMGNRVDYDGIRNILWQAGDYIYKNAIRTYTQKEGALKNNPKPESEAGLPEIISLPGGEYIYESVQDVQIDRAKLEELVNKLSAIYLDYPQLYKTNVELGIQYTDVYRLNSEGLKIRMPYTPGYIETVVSIRNADGVELTENYDIPFDARDYDADKIAANIREFADAMVKKSNAETVDDFYIGPILLEKQAVSESFHTIVKNYGTARNTWDLYASLYRYTTSSQTSLTGYQLLGKRFLDTKLSIHLYSNLKEYKGKKIAGAYDVDFDGVKPDPDFVMVENGMLKRLIGGRYPAAGAPRATGHAMIQDYSTVGNNKMSIMHVTCSKTIPQSKIKARLISEAKKAGLDHTYMLRNIEYNCYILTRIDVKTGQETIINADIPAFERRELMHVITASKEEEIQSSIFNGNTLSTMIAPESMILESVEMNIKKPTKAQEFQLTNPAWR